MAATLLWATVILTSVIALSTFWTSLDQIRVSMKKE